MGKLVVLAVLASLLGAVSCELSLSLSIIYKLYGYTTPGLRPYPIRPPSSAPSATQLQVGYYAKNTTCPKAEEIVRNAVRNASPGIQAGLIRLFFHDCFIRGCDASVLLNLTSDGIPTERQGGPNLSLRGFEVIDAAKEALEALKECKGVVSCADILAFAARDASYILSDGYINYDVKAGRYDGFKSNASETFEELPPPFGDLSVTTAMFAAKGLDEKDTVVLSGAHSIGRSACSSFNTASIEPVLGNKLNQTCGIPVNGATTVPQDYKTPDELDVQYYRNVQSGAALFNSDASLMTSPRTKELVDFYAANSLLLGFIFGETQWYKDFGKAMVKMGDIEVKTNKEGQIREKCALVNPPPSPPPPPMPY